MEGKKVAVPDLTDGAGTAALALMIGLIGELYERERLSESGVQRVAELASAVVSTPGFATDREAAQRLIKIGRAHV